MHLPDGLIGLPVAAATGAVAIPILGYSLHQLQGALGTRAAPRLGVCAAGVFAAQMINFPVAMGTSGHLIGGLLAAILLGPWGGIVVLSVVLLVQCLIFGDGGLLAYGANVLNLAVIGSGGGYTIYASLRRLGRGRTGNIVAAALAGWFSVLAAAIACAVELGLSGTFPLRPTLLAMLSVHLIIGLVEAIATALAVLFLFQTRPDLLEPDAPAALPVRWEGAAAGLMLALVVAVFLAPWASSLPDGMEWSLAQVAQAGAALPEPAETHIAPLADYQVPGLAKWEQWLSVAGGVGTGIVFGIGWIIARSLRPNPRRAA